MNNITFKQYRNIDLTIFAVLLVISEAVTAIATNTWFAAQPVALSPTLTFVCIVMMRWGGYAAIPALLGGLTFCIASGANPEQYVIYTLGNCLALLSLLWFKTFGKDEIRKSGYKLFFFTLTTYVMAQVGRWIVSLFFSGDLGTLVAYLATDIISLLFAVMIIFIMRKTDGMIEDQKAYLFRLQREREAERTQSFGGYGTED